MSEPGSAKMANESGLTASLPVAADHVLIHLADELIRLNGRVRSIFSGITEDSGLKAMELAVLSSVVGARQPPTVSQIGRSTGHPRQVVQRAANALIEAGLIETQDNPDHKRAPLLVATAAGEEIKQTADARAIAAADGLMQSIDEEKCARLTRELRVLRREIEAHVRGGKTE